jgi:hypothetical protein
MKKLMALLAFILCPIAFADSIEITVDGRSVNGAHSEDSTAGAYFKVIYEIERLTETLMSRDVVTKTHLYTSNKHRWRKSNGSYSFGTPDTINPYWEYHRCYEVNGNSDFDSVLAQYEQIAPKLVNRTNHCTYSTKLWLWRGVKSMSERSNNTL